MGFEIWTDVHDTPDQKKRLASAKTAACTPLSISNEDATGVFSGSSGVYNTTLETCTCVDHKRRKLPCKHMYRLAIELGVLNETAAADVSQIKRPASYGLSLEEAVDILETLPVSSQLVLKNTLLNKLFRKRETYKQKKPDGVAELIASGLVIDASDGAVSISDQLVNCKRKLYTYLLRKYEDEGFITETGKLYEYPHGANVILSSKVDETGERKISFEFPDDEVTRLLDKYGANRCRDYNKAPTILESC